MSGINLHLLSKVKGDRSEAFRIISIFVTSLRADFGRKVLNVWKYIKIVYWSANCKYKNIKTRVKTSFAKLLSPIFKIKVFYHWQFQKIFEKLLQNPKLWNNKRTHNELENWMLTIPITHAKFQRRVNFWNFYSNVSEKATTSFFTCNVWELYTL